MSQVVTATASPAVSAKAWRDANNANLAAADALATEQGTVHFLPPAVLNIEEGYNFRTFSPNKAAHATLMAQIDVAGVTVPLSIRRDDTDGKFYVLAGHLRLGAVRALLAKKPGHKRLQAIPCIVSDAKSVSSRVDRRYDLLQSNSGTAPTMLEYGIVCAGLVGDGETRPAIARRLGVSSRYISNLLVLANAPEAIRAALTDGAGKLGADPRISGTMVYEYVQKAGPDKADGAYTEILGALANAKPGAKVTLQDVKEHVRRVATPGAAPKVAGVKPEAAPVLPYKVSASTSCLRWIVDGAGVKVARAESKAEAVKLIGLLNKAIGYKAAPVAPVA